MVVLEDKIVIFNFADLELIRSHDTLSNPQGIVSLNSRIEEPVVAMLSTKRGYAKVSYVSQNSETEIECHQTSIKFMTLNAEGSMLATASVKGTLIRIFETVNGTPLRELRRGSENAAIQCIAFNMQSTYLACTSDKGTAHLFSLLTHDPENDAIDSKLDEDDVICEASVFTNTNDENAPKNKKSMLSFFSKILPKYYSSEWSFAQYNVGCGKEEETQ